MFLYVFTDVNIEKPPEEAILMYVSALRQAFPEMPPPHRRKVISNLLLSTSHSCWIVVVKEQWGSAFD